MQSSSKRYLSKFTIILVLVVAMLSVLTLTAYAASAKTQYSFTFNGIHGVKTVVGVKGDMDDLNTRGAGAVSINAAQFGPGSVYFWVNDPSGLSITEKKGPINRLDPNIVLTYTSLEGVNNGTPLTMYCQATMGVQGLGGNFQP